MVVAALNAIAEPFEEEQEVNERRQLVEGVFVLTSIRPLWLDALLQFASVVNPWNALNEFTSMFEDESFIGHIAFFVHAFGMAATTADCVGELEENYRVLATGIIWAKIGLLVLYARPILFIPRARLHMLVRAGSHVVNIALMLYGMQFPYPTFRTILIVATAWDWAALLLLVPIKQERVPLHVQSYADRIKEVTMVIFGEAIFAIVLQPHSEAKTQTHFYVALAATLWLIYAMALQEFHILPSEHDHALRRSLLFGYLWYYTQFLKQFFLLGTSIGIKRAHLLVFKAPYQPIDAGTRRLIVWGLSLAMLSTTMIRTYSFGFGRHPSKDDPRELYWLKVAWWTAMAVGVALPQIIDCTILEHYSSTPLVVLITFGCLLGTTILFEAFMSNLVANRLRKMMEEIAGCNPSEFTYIPDTSLIQSYASTKQEEGEEENQAQHQKCAFPTAIAPKKEES